MSDEVIQKKSEDLCARDEVYLRKLVRWITLEVGVVVEERQGKSLDLNETEVARVADRICGKARGISPLSGKSIDQVSMDDLNLAFSLAALRAAEENQKGRSAD